MNPFIVAYWRTRRKLAEDQDLSRREARRLPMWKLLMGEAAYLLGRLFRRR